jgi:hypothetical protein
MKKNLIILINLLAVNLSNAVSQTNAVNTLELKYPQIADMVLEVNNQNLGYENYNWINYAFVINVKKIADDYEFRIKIFHKTEFPSILRDTKDTLYGYCVVNNRDVVVFGDSAGYFFSKTNDSKEFDWLKPLPPVKGQVRIIPKDDREVWVYRFEKGGFKFYKKCHCGILDLSKRDENNPIPSNLISIALNSKEMKQYYHFEIKERPSLVILNKRWFRKPIDTIRIFDRPVKIIDTLTPELTNYISVISMKRKENKLELEFEYKIEGLLIKVELVINNGTWRKNNISIIER